MMQPHEGVYSLLFIFSRLCILFYSREKQGIEGGLLNDCLMIWCCGLCALVQEGQEAEAILGGGQAMERS